jgi:hypothetical protein
MTSQKDTGPEEQFALCKEQALRTATAEEAMSRRLEEEDEGVRIALK